MQARGPSLWRVRFGIALAALCVLLAVSMTSALSVALDLRPALLVVGAAASFVLVSARPRLPGRRGPSLLLGLAVMTGLASLWVACDLWLFYRTEEVRFRGERGVELAGTLYIPRSGGRHAAIVLVHGSGQNRLRPE